MALVTPERNLSIVTQDDPSTPGRPRDRIPSWKVQNQETGINKTKKPPTRAEKDAEFQELVTSLKEIILQQSRTINEIRTEQQNQYTKLKEEIRELKARLDALSVALPSTRSWASVAAGGKNLTVPGSTLTRTSNRENLDKDLNCIRISTQRSSTDSEVGGTEAFRRYLPTDSANIHIRNALQNNDTTKEAQIAGIGPTKTGYVIRFRDEQSTQAARNCTRWLDALGNGTRIAKPRFGVVVHRTPTENINISENQAEAIKRIMDENDMEKRGHQITEIAWLKRQDKPLGQAASLGIWFETEEAAEWTIQDGIVIGQRYISSIEQYKIQKKRCYRCQRMGHLARECSEAMRCRHCAGEHDCRECPPNTEAKCVDCNSAHPTGDRTCKSQFVPNTRL